MTAGRVRITDLTAADAGSPRYCGHSIGRVIEIVSPGQAGEFGTRWVRVDRIERSGDHVYGVGVCVSADAAAKLQQKWDIRWGLRVAPNPPAVPPAPKPDRRAGRSKFADIDAAAAAIVSAGYRELAKRCHPDLGGDHTSMSLLTQAKTQLVKILELAKGSAA